MSTHSRRPTGAARTSRAVQPLDGAGSPDGGPSAAAAAPARQVDLVEAGLFLEGDDRGPGDAQPPDLPRRRPSDPCASEPPAAALPCPRSLRLLLPRTSATTARPRARDARCPSDGEGNHGGTQQHPEDDADRPACSSSGCRRGLVGGQRRERVVRVVGWRGARLHARQERPVASSVVTWTGCPRPPADVAAWLRTRDDAQLAAPPAARPTSPPGAVGCRRAGRGWRCPSRWTCAGRARRRTSRCSTSSCWLRPTASAPETLVAALPEVPGAALAAAPRTLNDTGAAVGRPLLRAPDRCAACLVPAGLGRRATELRVQPPADVRWAPAALPTRGARTSSSGSPATARSATCPTPRRTAASPPPARCCSAARWPGSTR